jgi:hypothetical protein
MTYPQVIDAKGRDLFVGAVVNTEYQDVPMPCGIIVDITDWDGDVNDDTLQHIDIPPYVVVMWPYGTERFGTFPFETASWFTEPSVEADDLVLASDPVRDYSHTRGDVLTMCDVCDKYQFDVRLINVGGIEPWNWDDLMICGSCRFQEDARVMKLETEMARWDHEEKAWLKNGGQELIDSEPYVPCMACGGPEPCHCWV